MAHSIVDEHPALRESMRLKILVVDDHPLIREALLHVLTVIESEIKLFEACNGAEGLAAAEAHPDLDLVLLDLGLPDMDGFDALARLREGHPGLRIVVLSASEQAEIVVRALDAGAMGFIPKTSSNQLLINALRLVLSGGVYLPPEVLRRPSGAARPVSERTPASPQGQPPAPRDLGLTGRQAEVLALMVAGQAEQADLPRTRPTPTYIILASIAAPALGTLGVPLVATHFFVFYYGVLADVTPPVALAAYAAAGIAGSEPMRTGLTAFRLSMGKALVPFMFVYTPSLLFLQFQWPAFASAMLCGAIGIVALSAAYIGYFRAPLARWETAALTTAGLILVFNNFWANIIGSAVVLGLLGWNTLRARR